MKSLNKPERGSRDAKFYTIVRSKNKGSAEMPKPDASGALFWSNFVLFSYAKLSPILCVH